MLTFHLDVQSTDQFIQRVLHEVKLRMGDTSYRVVEVVKLGGVRIKGYYCAPKQDKKIGRSEYNATVDISVEVHTVEAKVIPLTFKMQNPLDLSLYNHEIERSFTSLDDVRAHETTLVTDYIEAMQSMVFLMPTGVYSKDTQEFICEVSCYGDSDIIKEGYKTYDQLSGSGHSITSVVGFTCRDDISTQGHGVPLWNVLSHVYLHEFLVYKQDWYEPSVKSPHEQAYAALNVMECGVSQGGHLIADVMVDVSTTPYICEVKVDGARNCLYFDVGYYAENGEDIEEWYHFTPLCCLRLVRLGECVSFEIVYDIHLHDYDYIIESYETVTPFISEFFKRYRKLM